MGTNICPYKDKTTNKHLENLRNYITISEVNKDFISLYLELLDAKGAGKYLKGKLTYQLIRISSIKRKMRSGVSSKNRPAL